MAEFWPATAAKPRARVVIDNDFSGDPDGLVQLAHHLLSPSVEIRAVIASHLRADDTHWNRTENSVTAAVEKAHEVINLCGLHSQVPVLRGADGPMADESTPAFSEGIDFIVAEAMRDDTDLPLYVACGGSLTQIASAYLREPAIADRLTVIWIGGREHNGEFVAQGLPDLEYNLHEDVPAGLVVFNRSELRVWQVPRNAYRQTIMSRAELLTRVAGVGALGDYLASAITATVQDFERIGHLGGECYVMGDSPLVLLSALQTTFEPDTASSSHVKIPCPTLLPNGNYVPNPLGRALRVYNRLDNRLMFEDFFAKLQLRAGT